VDPRDAARSLSIGRLAIGIGLILAPRLSTAMWLGLHAMSPAAKILTRALGARDAGLGAAVLAQLDGGGDTRPLLIAGIAADSTDLVATLLARDHLPRLAVPLIVAAAGSGIALGAMALGDSGAAPVPA
jgi:hypothetical protein